MESTFCESVPEGTRLIETFGWVPEQGFIRLDQHLARMQRSALAMGFAFDRTRALGCLSVAGTQALRCRLTLGVGGFEFTSTPMARVVEPWTVCFAPNRLWSQDVWLGHKTTQRALYDAARAALPDGIDELVFLNERGEVCEGTVTNIFVTRKTGEVITPTLACGVLPGVLRQSLIDAGHVQEGVLGLQDIEDATEIHMGNSLRGLIRVEMQKPITP